MHACHTYPSCEAAALTPWQRPVLLSSRRAMLFDGDQSLVWTGLDWSGLVWTGLASVGRKIAN